MVKSSPIIAGITAFFILLITTMLLSTLAKEFPSPFGEIFKSTLGGIVFGAFFSLVVSVVVITYYFTRR